MLQTKSVKSHARALTPLTEFASVVLGTESDLWHCKRHTTMSVPLDLACPGFLTAPC